MPIRKLEKENKQKKWKGTETQWIHDFSFEDEIGEAINWYGDRHKGGELAKRRWQFFHMIYIFEGLGVDILPI